MNEKDLEERMERLGYAYLDPNVSQLDKVTDILEKIKGVPEYCRAFNYLLSVTKKLDESGLRNDYAFLGGYAVFAHIFSVLGESSLKRWRGSEDLDLFSKGKCVSNIIGRHFEETETLGTHFMNKSSILVKDLLELCRDEKLKPLKIDFYNSFNGIDMIFDGQILDGEFWNRTELIEILGFKIKVLGLYDLLKLKINIKTKSTNLPRPRDITDIYNLIGVAEKKGKDAKSLFDSCNKEQKERLIKLFDISPSYETSEEVLINPSNQLILQFKKLYEDEIEMEKIKAEAEKLEKISKKAGGNL